jgi:hypothetical protein
MVIAVVAGSGPTERGMNIIDAGVYDANLDILACRSEVESCFVPDLLDVEQRNAGIGVELQRLSGGSSDVDENLCCSFLRETSCRGFVRMLGNS